jgi:putative intracellular protease/amidase
MDISEIEEIKFWNIKEPGILSGVQSGRQTQEADMSKGTVLVIGSNATRIEVQGGWAPTGQYLNETVVPAKAMIGAGYDLVLATPDGTRPHIDPASDTPKHFGDDQAAHDRARAFWNNDPAMNAVRTLRQVIDDGLDRYAGVFVPGGQAPAVDLMQSAELGEILRHFHEAGKPTGLLCHGPVAVIAALPRAADYRAALLASDMARAADLATDWIYAGYRMTVFSASEEKIVEDLVLNAKMHFDMPTALRTAGGHVDTTPVDFEPHVVVDRELITGQNPASDHPIAARFVEALDHHHVAA